MEKIVTVSPWEEQLHGRVRAGFSTKALGNIAREKGNDRKAIENRITFANKMGFSWSDTLILPMSHSNRVVSIPIESSWRSDNYGVYIDNRKNDIYGSELQFTHPNMHRGSGIDGIVTNIPGLFPVILAADCVVVGLHCTTTNTIGLVHAGLIGTINGIIDNTLRCMKSAYSAQPNTIRAILFPAIRSCHYDLTQSGVWKLVRERCLEKYGSDRPPFKDERCDLQYLITAQLIESGIQSNNIHDVHLCTVCYPSMFFSNAGATTPEAKEKEGRFANTIGILA